MNLTIIAAIGKNNELGKNNDLIWSLPNDLKFFKEKTTGHTIAMGKNTFYSLGRVLPNRKHVVFAEEGIKFPSEVTVFHSLEDFLNNYKSDDEIFIIGGASIYSQFINHVNKMYLTEVDDEADADVYFPKFNKDEWKKTIIYSNSDNGINYTHVLYEKIN